MSTSLSELERKRSQLQSQIALLGDFRAGSITGTGGQCGSPRCHCHNPGDPGHGPYFRLTHKVQGKTVAETFSSDIARRKAQREVEEFHRFRRLSAELLEVNEQICRLRPVPEEESVGEKKNSRGDTKRDRAGAERALVTVAHSLLVIVYHLLKNGTRYVDLGADYLDRLREKPLTRYLVRRLERLGHKVTLEPLEHAA